MLRIICFAMLLLPSAAHALYVARPTGAAQPTGAQLSALANWAEDVWPGLTPSNVQSLRCFRAQNDDGDWAVNCTAQSTETLMLAAFNAAEAGGEIARLPAPADIASNGLSCTVRRVWGLTTIVGANLTTLAGIVNGLWSFPAAQIIELRVQKRDYATGTEGEAGYEPPGWYVSAVQRAEIDASQRLACLRDETCAKAVQ